MKVNKPVMLALISFIVLFMTASSFVCAESLENDFVENPFYKGDLYFIPHKETYSAGEVFKAEFVLSNLEKFPLTDAYLVVELVKGGVKPAYPQHSSDTDNIFYEEKIEDINIAALSRTTARFSYLIPEDLSPGVYLLEVYMKTKRTPVIGLPQIMLSPKYMSFRVEGGGSFPSALISRTETVFANESAPVGVGVDGGSVVEGLVVIKSLTDSPENSMTLTVSVCEWDDTSCGESDMFFSKDYFIPSLAAGATTSVAVDFKSPVKPSAYAIRLELKDSGGRTSSLYRSRIVVKGETARIRKMAVDKHYYKQNEQGEIRVLVAPSPDHYTNPITENAKLSVYLKEDGRIFYTDSSILPNLSAKQALITAEEKTFVFTAPRELTLFEVCSQVDSSSGSLYDRYCFIVDSSKFGVGKPRINESQESSRQEINTTTITTLREDVKEEDGSPDSTPLIILSLILVCLAAAYVLMKKQKKVK